MHALVETQLTEGSVGRAARVAAEIRRRIMAGELLPGHRLTEDRMREDLDVSRSTLREGFQLLIRERLLVHRLSRGFFVRVLTREDIADLYEVRRVIECGALRRVTTIKLEGLRELALSVAKGRAAASQGDWHLVANASIAFHKALMNLSGSARLSAQMDQVLTEFRLAYAYMTDPHAFHAPFLERNAEIADQVRSGELDRAASSLEVYLDDAELAVLSLYSDPGDQAKTRSRNDRFR